MSQIDVRPPDAIVVSVPDLSPGLMTCTDEMHVFDVKGEPCQCGAYSGASVDDQWPEPRMAEE